MARRGGAARTGAHPHDGAAGGTEPERRAHGVDAAEGDRRGRKEREGVRGHCNVHGVSKAKGATAPGHTAWMQRRRRREGGGRVRPEGHRCMQRAGDVAVCSTSNKRRAPLCRGVELDRGAHGLEVVPGVDAMQGAGCGRDEHEGGRGMRTRRDCAVCARRHTGINVLALFALLLHAQHCDHAPSGCLAPARRMVEAGGGHGRGRPLTALGGVHRFLSHPVLSARWTSVRHCQAGVEQGTGPGGARAARRFWGGEAEVRRWAAHRQRAFGARRWSRGGPEVGQCVGRALSGGSRGEAEGAAEAGTRGNVVQRAGGVPGAHTVVFGGVDAGRREGSSNRRQPSPIRKAHQCHIESI
ncbi:hypothetical protein DFH07DRAFT_779783 [Mycena maculata]|uniref:Uncharacterized protein n=1 Tax=Mycena maculata TaxID=230809 RepID=A0AAD7I7V6_9AGAR|nr:hypothetical protein DFH07DRAFT_779783 [Mycena maculata]